MNGGVSEGVKDWFGLLARLVTGGVWIVAGSVELPRPADTDPEDDPETEGSLDGAEEDLAQDR